MDINNFRDIFSESQRNDDLYRSNIVVQFSKDKQYGLNGTQCKINVNPVTEDLQFEVCQKTANGVSHYEYKTVNKNNNNNDAIDTKDKKVNDHPVFRLWLYCIGVILIAIGLCLIAVGTVSNSKGIQKIN